MRRMVALLVAALATSGCGDKEPEFKPGPAGAAPPFPYGAGAGSFKDDVATNVTVGSDALGGTFTDRDGKPFELKQFRGKKNVLLVIMRGTTSNGLCLFCTRQTSGLIAQHDQFAKRGAEVVVVFPGESGQLKKFLANAAEDSHSRPEKVPFQVVLDPDFKVVERLGIRGDLAKPSTYILDKSGQVRFAYVGGSVSDRPSIKAMLAQLDAIGGR